MRTQPDMVSMATLAAMLWGLWRAPWSTRSGWRAPLLFLLALSLLHVVFWSTMRMRAPVMPVVFLLATVGVCGRPAEDAGSETRQRRLIDTPENTDL